MLRYISVFHFYDRIIFHCKDISHIVHLFILWWLFRLFTYCGCDKYCCGEHSYINICPSVFSFLGCKPGDRIAGLYIIPSLFAYIMCSTLNILAQCQVIFQSGYVNLIPTYNLLTLLFLPIQVGWAGHSSVAEHLSTMSEASSCVPAPTKVCGGGGWHGIRDAFEDVQKRKSSYIFRARKSKQCSYFPLQRNTAPCFVLKC